MSRAVVWIALLVGWLGCASHSSIDPSESSERGDAASLPDATITGESRSSGYSHDLHARPRLSMSTRSLRGAVLGLPEAPTTDGMRVVDVPPVPARLLRPREHVLVDVNVLLDRLHTMVGPRSAASALRLDGAQLSYLIKDVSGEIPIWSTDIRELARHISHIPSADGLHFITLECRLRSDPGIRPCFRTFGYDEPHEAAMIAIVAHRAEVDRVIATLTDLLGPEPLWKTGDVPYALARPVYETSIAIRGPTETQLMELAKINAAFARSPHSRRPPTELWLDAGQLVVRRQDKYGNVRFLVAELSRLDPKPLELGPGVLTIACGWSRDYDTLCWQSADDRPFMTFEVLINTGAEAATFRGIVNSIERIISDQPTAPSP